MKWTSLDYFDLFFLNILCRGKQLKIKGTHQLSAEKIQEVPKLDIRSQAKSSLAAEFF